MYYYMGMKKSIAIVLVLFSLGCEFRMTRNLPRETVIKVPTQTTVVLSAGACEDKFYYGGPAYYSWCSEIDNYGDCSCYVVHDYSTYSKDCYVEYCFWHDTCSWEEYDVFCEYY